MRLDRCASLGLLGTILVQAQSSWTQQENKNCYMNHGATEIDADSIGKMSLADCEKKCAERADCTAITMEVGGNTGSCWRRKDINISACDTDKGYSVWLKAPPSPGSTVSLMTKDKLGEFEDEHWEGYACTFLDWATCVNSTSSCGALNTACGKCTSKNESITCIKVGDQTHFVFPAGGIFPVVEQYTIPPNTAIVGAANPNDPMDKAQQQTNVAGQTWFVVPSNSALCGDDPLCKDKTAKARTACSGDPRTHRQGFLMSSHSMLKNINFQGADLGRAASEGTLCGPGAIELPGCLSGVGCDSWDGSQANGEGVVQDVVIQNVRLSDAVMRADVQEMLNDCNSGEALDADGNHVRAHQVSVWASKLPSSEKAAHTNVLIDNLVSGLSR
jgi:hypothetical protein